MSQFIVKSPDGRTKSVFVYLGSVFLVNARPIDGGLARGSISVVEPHAALANVALRKARIVRRDSPALTPRSEAQVHIVALERRVRLIDAAQFAHCVRSEDHRCS